MGMLLDAEQRACVQHYIAVEEASLSQVAREIGISVYRLRIFLDGVEIVDADEVEKLDSWCEGRPLPFVPPEEIAMQILVRWGAVTRRRFDRVSLANAVLGEYARLKFRVPPFVEDAIRG